MDQTERTLLIETATRFFKANHPLENRVANFRDGNPARLSDWMRLAELGLCGLSVPETLGGFGASLTSVLPLLELAGRCARPEPLGLHLLLAPLVLRGAAPKARQDIASSLIDGSRRFALSCDDGDDRVRLHGDALYGVVSPVFGGELATDLLVSCAGTSGEARLAWIDVSAAEVTVLSHRFLDGRISSELRLNGAGARFLELGNAGQSISRQAQDRADVSIIFDGAGSFAAVFDLTLDYLKARRQFGVPLSTFQAVQHGMAEVFCMLQEFLALAGRLAQEIDTVEDGPWPTLAIARAYLDQRVINAVEKLIQLTGGIALTEDYPLSHHYRRLHVGVGLLGTLQRRLEGIDIPRLLRAT